MRIFSIGVGAAALLTGSSAMAKSPRFERPSSVSNPFEPVAVFRHVSDTSWATETADGKSLGNAVVVCINGGECPAGAVDYGFAPGRGQGASVAWTSGKLIWAGGTTAKSRAPMETFRFIKHFQIYEAPQSAALDLAADDYARVEINGVALGEIGSVTSVAAAAEANSRPHRFDLSPYLKVGDNVVVVTAQNGPDSYAGGYGNGTYSGNPASIAAEISIPAVGREELVESVRPYAPTLAEIRVIEESYEAPPCEQGCGMDQFSGVVFAELASLGIALGLFLGLRRKKQ